MGGNISVCLTQNRELAASRTTKLIRMDKADLLEGLFVASAQGTKILGVLAGLIQQGAHYYYRYVPLPERYPAQQAHSERISQVRAPENPFPHPSLADLIPEFQRLNTANKSEAPSNKASTLSQQTTAHPSLADLIPEFQRLNISNKSEGPSFRASTLNQQTAALNAEMVINTSRFDELSFEPNASFDQIPTHRNLNEYINDVSTLTDMTEETFSRTMQTMKCPITKRLMEKPMVLSCGDSFQKESITKELEKGIKKCPKCKKPIEGYLIPNKHLKEFISNFKRRWVKKMNKKRIIEDFDGLGNYGRELVILED